MWIKTIVLVVCLVAVLAADKPPKKKDEARGKRNLQYNLAHHYTPHVYRRISTGPQIPLYHSQYFPGPRSHSPYHKGRPHSLPPPPYAVQMEPLVHYSQRDPLYDTNALSLNADGADDLLTDNNHISEHAYGPQKHVIERPVYIKEPEPIIEIIIKESNVTLPPPPAPPTPPPKKKEQVQVFYVKYKKNPNGHGKESIIYDKPVPAISPPVQDDEEEAHPPVHHQEVVTLPPPPSTTLRTIIRPDSETYHSPSGVKVTFGKEGFDYDKRSSKPEDLKASPDDNRSVQFPQGRQLSSFPPGPPKRPFTFESPSPSFRQPQPYRPFSSFRQPTSQTFPRPGPQEYSTLPKFPPQPPKTSQSFPPPRPVPPQFHRQPVPYQSFESSRPQFRPETHFPITQSPPGTERPAGFNQFSQSRPQPQPKPQFQQKPQYQPGPQFQQSGVRSQQPGPQFQQSGVRGQSPQFHQTPQSQPQALPLTQPQPQPTFQESTLSQYQRRPVASQNHNQFQQQFNLPQQFSSQHNYNQQHQFNQQQAQPINPQQAQSINSQLQQAQPVNPQPQQAQPVNPQLQQTQQVNPQLQQTQPVNPQLQHFHQQQAQPINPQLQHFHQQQQQAQPVNPQLQHFHQQQQQFNQQESIIPPGGELIHSVPKFEQHISGPLKGSQPQPQSQPQYNFQPQLQQSSIQLNPSGVNDKEKQSDYNDKLQQQLREANAFQESIRQSSPQFYNFQQSQSLNFYQSTSKPSTFYPSSTTTTTTTTQKPSTTTKDPKVLNAQLPDEVPDDLREQLLSSGILNNAHISVLDYDKVGDIPLSALPPDQLANFYSAGGAQQIQAGSDPVPAIADRQLDTEASEIHEVKVKPEVQMKVVRYDPETEKGQRVQNEYVEEDATQVDPVALNDDKFNRYLPLKISGAQFPIPDVPELKGKKITSVVVLAPVAYEFSSSRQTREAKEEEVELLEGQYLKTLLKEPTKENFEKFLEQENKTKSDQQAVILLVTKPSDDSKDKEIFMYDVATKTVSKLDGELSTAFVEAAEANSGDTKASASSIVETRVPYDGDLTPDGSEHFETIVDLSGNPVEDDLTASETHLDNKISKTGRLP